MYSKCKVLKYCNKFIDEFEHIFCYQVWDIHNINKHHSETTLSKQKLRTTFLSDISLN